MSNDTNIIHAGISELQELCGSTAASKGFHEDRPKPQDFPGLDWAKYPAALANWQGNKLLLVVSEVIEAHDEIRSGHAADETYYNATIAPALKPEGVPSEIADAVIRCFDFAYTEGFNLADIIIEKLAYNATRPYKHNKAF